MPSFPPSGSSLVVKTSVQEGLGLHGGDQTSRILQGSCSYTQTLEECHPSDDYSTSSGHGYIVCDSLSVCSHSSPCDQVSGNPVHMGPSSITTTVYSTSASALVSWTVTTSPLELRGLMRTTWKAGPSFSYMKHFYGIKDIPLK